jgi:hypothetical protein
VAEIWRYGSDAAQIPERLAAMLRDLRSVALLEHRDAIESWWSIRTQPITFRQQIGRSQGVSMLTPRRRVGGHRLLRPPDVGS